MPVRNTNLSRNSPKPALLTWWWMPERTLFWGHHPHVLQRVEEYKGKFILYSLGNFVFDQKWSRATREGLLARIFITRDGVEKVEFLPVYSNDQNQPQLLEGKMLNGF